MSDFNNAITQLRKDIKSDMNDLKRDITETINSNQAALKESITDKLKPIEQTQDRHRKDIDAHFTRLLEADKERKVIENDVNNLKLQQQENKHDIKTLKDQVSGLDRRQSTDEGEAAGKRRARDNWFKRNGLALSIIGAIIAIAGFLFGIIRG